MNTAAHILTSALSTNGSAGAAGAGASLGGFIAFVLIFLAAVLAKIVLIIVSTWIVYKKAGKPGWASIIPFYRTAVLLEIVKKPLWWIILLSFVPFVNIVLAVIVLRRLAKSFGKGRWFTVGLLFLPFIFFPILAFGSSVYVSTTYGEPAPMSEAVKWALIAAVIFAVSESLVISSLFTGIGANVHQHLRIISSEDAYATDGNYVYSSDIALQGADPDSFTDVGEGYGADRNSVYYYTDKVRGADADSFKSLGYGYGVDGSHVYYDGAVVDGADPVTFSVLSNEDYNAGDYTYDAKDSMHRYSLGKLVK